MYIRDYKNAKIRHMGQRKTKQKGERNESTIRMKTKTQREIKRQENHSMLACVRYILFVMDDVKRFRNTFVTIKQTGDSKNRKPNIYLKILDSLVINIYCS